MAEMI